MVSISVELPDNLPACHAIILRQAETIESLTARVEELLATTERLNRDLATLKRQLFGSRRERFEAGVPEESETLEASGIEGSLVEGPATDSEPVAGEASPEATIAPARRTSKGRQKRVIDPSIPREKIFHRLQERDVPPELWNHPLAKRFFRFVREEVELQQTRLRVLEHYEEVIALEDDTTGESRLLAASAPEPLIDRCYVGEGFLAYLAASRFADHIPYYREEDILTRFGFSIHRATQWRWMRALAGILLPLYERMRARGDAIGGAGYRRDSVCPDLPGTQSYPQRLLVRSVWRHHSSLRVLQLRLAQGRGARSSHRRELRRLSPVRCLYLLRTGRHGLGPSHHPRRLLGPRAPEIRTADGSRLPSAGRLDFWGRSRSSTTSRTGPGA